MRNFADSYRETVAGAADRIIRETEDPSLRRRAHQAKLSGATAMYDIVADPVPAASLLNAVTMVSLQTNLLRRHGDEFFGKFHPALLERTEYLQEEVYRIAARVMGNQQRTDLLNLCNQWSEANPDQYDIWYVRLDDLPGLKSGGSILGAVDSLTNMPGVFLNKINPFSAAQDAASEASVLAERLGWLAPRLMILAQWRAEAVIYDTLATTEVAGTLDQVARLTQLAEDLPNIITEQREALFQDLNDNQGTINTLLTNTEAITDDATQLVTQGDQAINSTTALMKEIDGIVARVQAMQQLAADSAAKQPPQPAATQPAKPFDINEYTETVRALNGVVNDTTELVKTANHSLTAESIDQKLDPIRETLTSLIWLTGGVVVGGGLILILAVKFIPSRRHRHHEA